MIRLVVSHEEKLQKIHHKDIELTEVKHKLYQAKGLRTLQSKKNPSMAF